MIKKFGILVLALAFAGITTAAHADADELLQGMGDKIWRGAVNTLTGWVELPAQIIKGYNEGFMGDEDNKIVGTVAGIFDGIFHGTGRTVSGIGELATFWAASPSDNEDIGLPLDAEYAWEEGTPYDIMDPDLVDGLVMPMGRKLVRGLGNVFLGVAEVPGQIVKGVQEGAPDAGIVKGIWYWFSRSADGAIDVATFYMNGPSDTNGMAFDEEWPWDALIESME